MKSVSTRQFTIILLSCLFLWQLGISQPIVNKAEGKRPKLGLVLSGGGAKGFAYIGVLKVMQEAGLPVDYVGGTSIGSIIAGLYAIGYHPDSIAAIVRSQDWNALLKDEMERKYIAFEEKEFGDKAIVTLPFKEKSVALSPALYHGQEINLLLNRYFSPAYKTKDFSKLQTPFICIGTDLIDGKQVVIDKGNLSKAIRASMSIPGYFTPTEYENYYLVDGGLINNYPVNVLKERGAEFILGADVQSGLYRTIEELNSLTRIIDQITGYYRMEANKVGYENTDLYIPIKMPYGMMDFEKYDSIIAIGEQVARNHYDDIKALADSLNAIEYQALKPYTTGPIKTIQINEVRVIGSKKMSESFFESTFEDVAHHEVSMDLLEEKIRLLNGTRFFKYVFYELQYEDGKTNLIVEVEDADPGYLSAGIHYDNDYKGSILVNAAMRNVLGKRTKLFVDLVLGTNLRMRALYMLDNGAKPGFGVMADMFSFRFYFYEKDERVNTFDISNYKGSVFFNTTLRNNYNFRTGFEYEYARFKQDIVIDEGLEKYRNFESYGNIFLAVNALTYNKKHFATKGLRSELKVRYVMPLTDAVTSEVFTSKLVAQLKYDHNLPLSPKFTLKPGLFCGVTFDKIVNEESKRAPVQHWFAMGGLNPENYLDSHVSFTGVNFIQSFGSYAWVGRMKLQYQMMNKVFLTLRADVGANEDYIEEVFDDENIMAGYGITASYNSFIGPVEVTVMGSNMNPTPMVYLNIGYWF